MLDSQAALVVALAALLAMVLGYLVAALIARSDKRQSLEKLQTQLDESQALLVANEQNLKTIGEQKASLEVELKLLHQRKLEIESQLNQQSQKIEQVQSEKQNSEQSLKVMQAQLHEREENFKQQLANFQSQREDLKKEFSYLANKIFEEKGKSFTESSKSSIDQMLKPFREQIDGFQKRVNEVHTQSVQGHTQIQEQIKSVLEVGLKMSDEANNLASALKSDKKAQGSWSEIQAELLLEMSGLKKGREYLREESIKAEDGREQRPDFIVNLPNNKHIIIDSKISLNAYVAATAASEAIEIKRHMDDHVVAIRNHVKSLSDKNYPKLKGVNSPEYVFMFIGNEPAYLAAFDNDPNLFQDAYRKGIAIVTPNTLLSSLTIVSHLWSIDKQNSNTRQLAEQASKVYDKLRVFIEKMDKLGNQLNTVQNTYDDGVRTLKAGKGNLTSQVEKFVEMGVAVKERIAVETDETELLEEHSKE